MMRFPGHARKILPVIVCVVAVAGAGAEPAVLSLDSPNVSWHPVSDGVKVTAGAASGESVRGIRISGTVPKGEDCAVSDFILMSGYMKYRLTASVPAHDITPLNPSPDAGIMESFPLLRVEFLLDTVNGPLGKCVIGGLKKVVMNERVRISGEFRAPWGTKMCRIVCSTRMGKRGRNGVFIPDPGGRKVDVSLDSVTISPIGEFSLEGRYTFDPVPSSLEKTRGVHPRLYVRKEGLPGLAEKSRTTHARIWNRVRSQAERYLRTNPPEYRGNIRGIYDEQWWMSRNAETMITLAMAYLVTGEKPYLEGARKWALATCEYPSWGVGWADGVDCMTGHNLYGLAIVYDWLHDSLDREALGTIRETLVTHGRRMFETAGKGTIVPSALDYRIQPWPEWEEAWLQNHLWVNSCGLGAAGLALFDEVDDAGRWVTFAEEKFLRTMELLGPDGASHEGINYWSYGVEQMLKFMYLSRDLLDVDMYQNDWFRHTATYRMYMSMPRNAWARENFAVNYADSYPRDYKGPDYLLHALASEYKDGHAQWLADTFEASGVENTGNDWLDMIWYNPSIPAEPPADLPTLMRFDDQGFVTARSGWDGGESFLFFSCGPYIGRKAISEMNYDASSAHHVHPDKNAFMLHGAGEWLIRDDGTGSYGKYTIQHNTLMIDGREQLGGGDSIFDGTLLHANRVMPEIVRAESHPGFDHIAGDATVLYAADQGLKRFVRHLIFLKPDVLIVVDDIALDHAHTLDLRFHPESREAKRVGNVIETRGGKAALRIEPLTPEKVDISIETHPMITREYATSPMLAVRLGTKRSVWRNATAFSWSPKSAGPVKVTLKRDGDLWRFGAGGRTVVFDWKTSKAEMGK